jgi:hypothetical protein
VQKSQKAQGVSAKTPKGSRWSANPEKAQGGVHILKKAQGGVQMVNKAQGGVQVVKKDQERVQTTPKGSRGGVQTHPKAQGGVQIQKRLKVECKSWKGSRWSAHSEKAQGGVHILKEAQGGVHILERLKGGVQKTPQAQGGVQNLKRLKGECRIWKGSRGSATSAKFSKKFKRVGVQTLKDCTIWKGARGECRESGKGSRRSEVRQKGCNTTRSTVVPLLSTDSGSIGLVFEVRMGFGIFPMIWSHPK